MSDHKPSGGYIRTDGPPIAEEVPVAVYLHRASYWKIIGPIVGSLIAALVVGVTFYVKTQLHVDDKEVHLDRGERSKIETVAAADKRQEKMIKNMGKEISTSIRESKVEFRESINKLSSDIRESQVKMELRLTREVKRSGSR